MVAVAAVAGIVVGALVAWGIGARRTAALRSSESDAQREAAVARAQLASASEALERERVERADAMRGLETTFKSLSQDVLDDTITRFRASQEDVTKERDARLDKTLEPLSQALADHQRSLAEYNRTHTGALEEVKGRADRLLEAQAEVQRATTHLADVLGRGDQRGRWGEFQLKNVLEKSGLREGVDFDLQVTETTAEGRRQRPDCVVNLPNGHHVAVDAKFPFDAFESALAADDPDQKKRLFAEHAAALRKHIRALRDRGYWEQLESPEFVVCFVPSDFAITAALDADPQLLAQSASDRVLLAGPTNLFSLLWSVAMIVNQHRAMVNAQEILKESQKIVDRIRKVFSPVDKMGKSLRDAVA
ncbi:MAG TPA: DNA recombination protein RmuC, partial [Acidimicrobiales bacterium]|nr:DNA recombination protein RmuC [Acidimicrobiales bacterium]